jgi:hypothetical protein
MRESHLNTDWFGMSPGPNNTWLKPSPMLPRPFPTGWWNGYQGDPEAIMREGMIRAVEVSYGIDHGAAVPDPPPRFWPIDVTWICQGPFFQCWIMWHEDEAPNGGRVTLLIMTPAGDGFPLTSRITRVKPAARQNWPDPDYADSRPAPPNDARSVLGPGAQKEKGGMWVVGHEDYEKRPSVTLVSLDPDREFQPKESDNSTMGSFVRVIPLPTLSWRAKDPNTVVCVRPSFWEGGMRIAPFEYTP